MDKKWLVVGKLSTVIIMVILLLTSLSQQSIMRISQLENIIDDYYINDTQVSMMLIYDSSIDGSYKDFDDGTDLMISLFSDGKNVMHVDETSCFNNSVVENRWYLLTGVINKASKKTSLIQDIDIIYYLRCN
jgi:hypothetical protein